MTSLIAPGLIAPGMVVAEGTSWTTVPLKHSSDSQRYPRQSDSGLHKAEHSML